MNSALTHSQAFRKDSFAVLLSVSDLLQHPPSSSLLGIGFREMHSRGGAVFYQRTNEQVREMLCQVVVENVGPEAQNRPKLARVRLLCFIFRWILHELYRKRPIGFFPLFLRCSFVPRTPFFSTFNKSLAGRLPPEETNRLRILACFFSARENYHDDDLWNRAKKHFTLYCAPPKTIAHAENITKSSEKTAENPTETATRAHRAKQATNPTLFLWPKATTNRAETYSRSLIRRSILMNTDRASRQWGTLKSSQQ